MSVREVSRKGSKKNEQPEDISKLRSLFNYFINARAELRKVSWPTRKETVTTGIAVFVVVFVVSLFLGLVDLGISSVIRYLLSL